MRNQQDKSMKVAIAGMGAIGRKIAKALDDGIPGMALEAVAVGNPQKASEFLTGLKRPPRVLALNALAQHADIVSNQRLRPFCASWQSLCSKPVKTWSS